MGILSVHRNMLSSCKSQLKYLSSSSNWWFIRRISNSNTGSSKAQSHAPTGDLKSNNKLMFLIEHFHIDSGTHNVCKSLSGFPPYNYSLISPDQNSWKDYQSLCNNLFSRFGNYILAASCNELLLFFLYKNDAPYSGPGKYLLWNPTMDKFKILPNPGPAFVNKHGFGYDSDSEDYKVVRFPTNAFAYKIDELFDKEVELYSLKTNSWKKIIYPHDCSEPLQKPCVHVNGVHHWVTIISGSYATILSFDFANEKFSSAPHIPRPPKFDKHSRGVVVDDFVLVEFNGSLAALVHSELGYSEKPFSFEVWGWNGESWNERVPRTKIDVPGGVVKVVGLFQNDKLFLQRFKKGELMLFDLAQSKQENLGIRADPQLVNIFPFKVSISIPFVGNK